MNKNSYREIASSLDIPDNGNKISKVQEEYVRRVFDIINLELIPKKVEELGSEIEPLLIVDENDNPIFDEKGRELIEFRGDFKKGNVGSEFKNVDLYCRISLFVIEDFGGNIIVSKRNLEKTHPGMFEIPGGHVIAGNTYEETVFKEVEEELGFNLKSYYEENKIDSKFLFKYRNIKDNTNIGNIVGVFSVRIPSISDLKIDENEIEELISYSPPDLKKEIELCDFLQDNPKFAIHHAYRYLMYLKENHNLDTSEILKYFEEKGLMKGRYKI